MESGAFYEKSKGFYITAIVLSLLWVLFVIIVACCRGSYYDSHKPKTYLSVIWSVMKVYHPLIAPFAPLKPHQDLYIPATFHALSLLIYVFSIVLFTCLDFRFIIGINPQMMYTSKRAVIFAAVYLAALIVLRPLFNKIKYALDFKGTSLPNDEQQSTKAIRMEKVIDNGEH